MLKVHVSVQYHNAHCSHGEGNQKVWKIFQFCLKVSMHRVRTSSYFELLLIGLPFVLLM